MLHKTGQWAASLVGSFAVCSIVPACADKPSTSTPGKNHWQNPSLGFFIVLVNIKYAAPSLLVLASSFSMDPVENTTTCTRGLDYSKYYVQNVLACILGARNFRGSNRIDFVSSGCTHSCPSPMHSCPRACRKKLRVLKLVCCGLSAIQIRPMAREHKGSQFHAVTRSAFRFRDTSEAAAFGAGDRA